MGKKISQATRQHNLSILFELIRKLYSIEDLDQEFIDSLLISYLYKSSLIKDWHISMMNSSKHAFKMFLDELNRGDILNPGIAETAWDNYMESEDNFLAYIDDGEPVDNHIHDTLEEYRGER